MKITTIKRKIKKNCSSFDFENLSILHVCPQWNQWLFLEAWYPNKEENSIDQHVEFLRVYLKLKNFITFLAPALCISATLPILPSLFLFAYATMKVTDMIETFYFLNTF